MGKSAPSAPPPPDYAGAAKETATGNLEAARANIAANRVNQVTPYGTLKYEITGQDPYGNPTWTATQSLSPDQQRLSDIQNKLSIGTGELGEQGLGYVREMISKPFDTSTLPKLSINPGESYQDAYIRRLGPQIQQNREQLEVDLANRGIPVGSEAYNRAKMLQAQKENDLMLGATTQGFDVGNRARAAAFGELAYQRNEPLNTLNAVRSGAQLTAPQFVNPAMQAVTAGPDLLSAAQATGNQQMNAYNANVATQNANTQGLYSLGGSALMAGAMFF